MASAVSEKQQMPSSALWDKLVSAWVCIGPFAALIGNAGSDMWLVGTILLALATSYKTSDWPWLKEHWFIACIVFWIWVLVAALLSERPLGSLEDAWHWIRFPVFSACIALLIGKERERFIYFIWASLLATIVMSGFLLVEKLNNPNALRLLGPWGQDSKAGWYLMGFGLPASMGLIYLLSAKRLTLYAAHLALGALLIAALLNGQIYMTFVIALAILIFLLSQGIRSLPTLLTILLSIAAVTILLLYDPAVMNRFTRAIFIRLPWLETSDYYFPWFSSFTLAATDWLTGIGPTNYFDICNRLIDIEKDFPLSGRPECFPHSHQLYLQFLAETGLVGLVFFVVAALLIVKRVFSIVSSDENRLFKGMAIAMVIAVLWPVSTYSDAFGQHLNFFVWLLIGLSLAMTNLAEQSKNRTR